MQSSTASSTANVGGVQADNTGRMLALCGLVAPILFGVLVFVAGSLRPGYSHVSDVISELGVGSNSIIQQANFMITGLLIIAFAFGLNRSISDGRILKVASGFLVVMGVGVFGAGLFSCDPGCPSEGSFTNLMHDVFSLPAFIAFVVTPLLFWRGLRKDSRWQSYRTFSLIMGLATLGLTFVFFPSIESPLGGVYQRLVVGGAFLWIELMAIKLLRLSQ